MQAQEDDIVLSKEVIKVVKVVDRVRRPLQGEFQDVEVNIPSSISNISFHSGLPILANGSYSDFIDRSVQFFNVPELKKVGSIEWGAQKVNCVAFHPRLDVMLTGDANNNVKLWNVTTTTNSDNIENVGADELVTLGGHSNVISCIAFHLKKPFFATGSWDRTVKIWHYNEDKWSDTKCIHDYQHDSNVTSIAFHPTQHIIAITSSSRGAKMIDFSDYAAAETGIVVSRTIPSDITLGEHIDTTCVAFHPGPINFILAVGGHVYDRNIGSNIYSIKLWDYSPSMDNPTCVATLIGHRNTISSMIFHPSIPLLVSGSYDGTVKFWGIAEDIKETTCVHTVEYQLYGINHVTSIAIKDSLLATGTYNGMLRLYNIADLMSRLKGMNSFYIKPTHADRSMFDREIPGTAQTTMSSKTTPFGDPRRRTLGPRGGNKTKRNRHKLSRKRYSRTFRKKRKSHNRR